MKKDPLVQVAVRIGLYLLGSITVEEEVAPPPPEGGDASSEPDRARARD